MNNKIDVSLRILPPVLASALLAAAFLLTGCSPKRYVRVSLAEGESLAAGSPVLVDETPAGEVKKIEQVGSHQIAVLRITEPTVIESKLRVGLVRVRDGGASVRLSTALIAPDAAALPDGATVETQSKLELLARRVSDQRNWGLIGALLTLGGTLGFVLVRIMRMGRLFIALVIAAGAAWVLHPNVVPLVERLYARAATQSSEAERSHLSSSTASAWEDQLMKYTRERPAPRTVALVVTFLGCALIASTVARALR